MAAPPINPYESPRPVGETENRVSVTANSPALVATAVVFIAGVTGGISFVAMRYASGGNYNVAVVIAIVLNFFVLNTAEGFIYQRRPSFASAVIGMLLASPIAYGIAFWIGLQWYDMYVQRIPGAFLVGWLAYVTFFLILSLGGWLAICRTHRVILEQPRSNDPRTTHG
jgi:hypothetical protein